jgi:hypothetical protein
MAAATAMSGSEIRARLRGSSARGSPSSPRVLATRAGGGGPGLQGSQSQDRPVPHIGVRILQGLDQSALRVGRSKGLADGAAGLLLGVFRGLHQHPHGHVLRGREQPDGGVTEGRISEGLDKGPGHGHRPPR